MKTSKRIPEIWHSNYEVNTLGKQKAFFAEVSWWIMYLGSVKFFKHLYVSLFFLLVLAPTSTAVYFGVLLNNRQSYSEPTLLNGAVSIVDNDTNDKTTEQSLSEENAESEKSPDTHFIKYNNISEHPYYENLFPEMYASPAIGSSERSPKSVYLTFDDGPSERTTEILNILKDHNIKATFFVVGDSLKTEANQTILKRMVAEGHTIGIHTTSHKYSAIYDSVESFLTDFNETYEMIDRITGTYPEVFRFPGGSINGYNIDIYQELISEMIRRGFIYYDWNVSAADAGKPVSVEDICNNVITPTRKAERAIVLMHDSVDKANTVKSLPTIIDTLSKDGFTFKPITRTVKPIIFGYKY